jgi:hypothetical protein
MCGVFNILMLCLPITAAARFKTRSAFAPPITGIVDSKPTQGMDVCLFLYCVCDVLCRQRPCDGVLPTTLLLRN